VKEKRGLRYAGHPIIPLSSIFSSDVISGSSGFPGFLTTLHLWFFVHFFGGFSCLRMSPHLIVTFIRHLHALSARIAHHPLSKLGARQEARDCPSRGLKPLRPCTGSLAEDGSIPLSLNIGWVKGLLSFHQRPGDHQHLGGNLHQHLRADAFLPLAAFQEPVVMDPEVGG